MCVNDMPLLWVVGFRSVDACVCANVSQSKFTAVGLHVGQWGRRRSERGRTHKTQGYGGNGALFLLLVHIHTLMPVKGQKKRARYPGFTR